MQPNLCKSTVFAGLLALSPGLQAEPATFEIDDEHFSMSFDIMHIGYAPVMGMFREVKGQFVYDEATQELISGELVFQADSVFTNHEKRDDHLRKPDFLDAKAHPEIRYVITGFERTGDNTGVVSGNLTMLGQTREVPVEVTLNKSADYPIGHEDYTLGISAEAALDRSDWGMTYGVENALVGDRVHLRFGFEANRDDGWF